MSSRHLQLRSITKGGDSGTGWGNTRAGGDPAQ